MKSEKGLNISLIAVVMLFVLFVGVIGGYYLGVSQVNQHEYSITDSDNSDWDIEIIDVSDNESIVDIVASQQIVLKQKAKEVKKAADKAESTLEDIEKSMENIYGENWDNKNY